MKILLLTPYVPSVGASHAGAVSLHHIVNGLSASAEVTLVTLRRPEEGDPAALADRCAAVHAVPYGSVRAGGGVERLGLVAGRGAAWLRSRVSGKPFFVEKYWSGRLAARLREICRKTAFDVAQVEFNMMAQYRGALRARATVLDLHEVGILPALRYCRTGPGGLRGALRRDELRRWVRYETTAYGGFDRVLTVTDTDREALLAHGSFDNLATNAHGISADDFAPVPGAAEPGAMVFVGSFAHDVNVDAMVWFVDEILPRIRRRRADARLYIVGSYPPPRIRAMEEPGRIVVTGFVDRVQDYIARAEVVLAPLRVGGGIKIKVLQALAMEKAVVTTPVGVDGIEGEDGTHFLVASTPEAFATGVLTLLDDAPRREAMGRLARRLVLDVYDWKVIASRFFRVYEEILAGEREGGGGAP